MKLNRYDHDEFLSLAQQGRKLREQGQDVAITDIEAMSYAAGMAAACEPITGEEYRMATRAAQRVRAMLEGVKQ